MLLRGMEENEKDILRNFLYEAIFIPEGVKPPDRTTITQDEFDQKLMNILKMDTWIIDGNYGRTIEMRLKYCDTVFLLDYPLEVCLAGAKARVGKKREEIPWVEEELDEEFRQWIIDFPEKKLLRIYELLEQYGEGKDFDYWIADLYFPWKDIPEGCETRVIPGSAWAQFPCTIKTLQDTNTKIWSEWLPALQGYSLAGEYDIEVYLPPEEESDDMKVYIWIPLKKD